MSAIHDEAFPEFEKMGEAEVRRKMECGELHNTRQEPAKVWLRLKEAERATSIVESVKWARHAAYAAYAAAVIAAISIITTIIINK